jgi:UDP-N-acetylglucosamine 2-epimerase (non-hydrolysing)
VQEESSYFNVPCLTVRGNTERPVTCTDGTNKLIGTDYKKIPNEVNNIDYNRKSDINLWDGNTSKRITEIFQEKIL